MNTATATIDLNPTFKTALTKILEPVSEALTKLINLQVILSSDDGAGRPIDEIFGEASGGVICCRSALAGTEAGIGGILLHTDIAVVASCAAMMVEPDELQEQFEFDGVVQEAMSEIWNCYISSWNSTSPPEYQLSDRPEERAVEFYSNDRPFPEAAGVPPYGYSVPIQVGDTAGTLTLLLPPQALVGEHLQAFTPPAGFVQHVTAPDSVPPAGASPQAHTAAGTAPAAPEVPTGQPVVFFDYTGEILKYLHKQAASQRTQCLFSKSLDADCLPGDGDLPAASIVVGIDPEKLASLGDCSCVEIRPRQ